MLWIISKHAWYKVAGSGWWDFVAPHSTYAPYFEPSRKVFALACLVARALQSRYAQLVGAYALGTKRRSGTRLWLLFTAVPFAWVCIAHLA